MLKPICVPCNRFFRPYKNGIAFTEGMPIGLDRALPGNSAPEQWKPYKIWMGDMWRCQGCNAEIIVGVGSSPIAIQHQANFSKDREELGADYQVNDC